MAARNRFGSLIAMNLRYWLIAMSAIALTSSACAQTGASDLTPRQYGSPLQRNMTAAMTPPAQDAADAARRCGELAYNYANAIGPQAHKSNTVGSPNYGRDGRNVDADNDVAARNRRDDAEKAYLDSGCH